MMVISEIAEYLKDHDESLDAWGYSVPFIAAGCDCD